MTHKQKQGVNRVKSISLVALSLLVTFFSSCASGPAFSEAPKPPPGKASVCVYRQSRVLGSGGSPRIYINGENEVTLSNGSYFVYLADPGLVSLTTKSKIMTKTMTSPLGMLGQAIERAARHPDVPRARFFVKEGETYYVEWLLEYKMEQRNKAEAIKHLKKCRRVGSNP